MNSDAASENGAMISIPEGVKGLIFDCDGTLADTMPIHIEAWCHTFAIWGIPCPVDFIEDVKGMPAEKIVAEYNRRNDLRIDPKAFAAEKNQRAYRNLAKAQPIRPVVDIAFRYRGLLPMAVASGGTRVNVMVTLAAIGLVDSFDIVITADDPVAPKPDPQIFLEAARRMGVEPAKCQVFEDGIPGLEAARRAGMVVTDIRPFIQ